jgi:hypothetical protein
LVQIQLHSQPQLQERLQQQTLLLPVFQVLLEQSRLSQLQLEQLQWLQQQQSQLHLGQRLHKFPKQKSPLLYAGGLLL